MANTGRIRYREQDMNPQSPTFGQQRWSAYENNTQACPLPQTFFSVAISGYTAKTGCPVGMTGQQVFYTVQAGYASSLVSQDDADSKARAYYENSRQAYANANGTCLDSTGNSGRSVSVTRFRQLSASAVRVILTRDDTAGLLVATLSLEDNSLSDGNTGPRTVQVQMQIPTGQNTAQQDFTLEEPLAVTDVRLLQVSPNDYYFTS